MKRLRATFLVASVCAGCAHSESATLAPVADATVNQECSSYFCVDLSSVPPSLKDSVTTSMRNVDAVLKNEAFLEAVRAKTQWTFVEQGVGGADVVRRLQSRAGLDGGVIRPTIVFYSPPWFGKDVCGGRSFGPKRTSSTGCTSGDGLIIRRNIEKHSPEGKYFMEFLVHEWLHAADFEHGSNFKQCSREKRNSVPIHVACLAVAYPDLKEMAACALACGQSDDDSVD
jgi:hypothetical protein